MKLVCNNFSTSWKRSERGPNQAEATAAERHQALQAALQATQALQAIDPLLQRRGNPPVSHRSDARRRRLASRQGSRAPKKSKEFEVQFQPTATTIGFADYVLFDDNGKPLAVLEAKKTSRNSEDGKTQARLYATASRKCSASGRDLFHQWLRPWIWNDEANEPPQAFGFYSKDSLQHIVFQRTERQPLSEIRPNPNIAGRMYQIEAVRRVVERFAEKKRKALLVLATGTGKTRVAISLCDAMVKTNWAKRILFLCDRRALRTQAKNAFTEYLPSLPLTIVTGASAGNTNDRIFLGTYPAMMKIYQSFDVGFFDLIIADESHRSLYNRYRQIFGYFDCFQVGLTATPVDFVARNTFEIFQCEPGDPTVNFTYKEAIEHRPAYLVPFKVETHTTEFLREGIKYSKMSEEQRRQLEEDEELPEAIEYEQAHVDKIVYNKDTNRQILRNLMEHGIRVANGSRLGKTIIFARSMKHARLLRELFDQMYPQYGGKFCEVIVSDDPRAESLIADFKGEGTNPDLTIAISVDMLDTGVDVPECVNLVFAKPVYSIVKFWQMIGRGTRLCPNLFGPGQHKTHFQIFDHWANFERFEQGYESAEPSRPKSLAERVFEARLQLAQTALDRQNAAGFELATQLLQKQVADLPMGSIPVMEKRKVIQSAGSAEALRRFDAGTKATLQAEIAPLMQWIDIAKYEEAYKFDRLIAQLQAELIRGGNKFDDMRGEVVNLVSALRINLSQVKVKLPIIERVKSKEFWDEVTVANLEEIRVELRDVVRYRQFDALSPSEPVVVDVGEDESKIERRQHTVQLDTLKNMDMFAYRNRVHQVLQSIFDRSETLQKIKTGQPVTDADIEDLCSLVLTQEPGLDLHDLTEYFRHAKSLDQAIREIIGMDAEAVYQRFSAFVRTHSNLAAHQIKFLDLLQKHIARYGSIKMDELYQPPFTSLHKRVFDGLFDPPLADELLESLERFSRKEVRAARHDDRFNKK
ncbi:MAG: DEAD/DEAH box helicase family protein [Planctomycetota bacterium]